jgi:hypothetical protein
VALIGHGHSGKTTLAAGFLYTSGGSARLTRVDEGNTITDFDDDEVQRKMSISTGIAYAEWMKKKINIIDTPGFNIFINDTKAALAAADCDLVLVDGVAGGEVHTEKGNLRTVGHSHSTAHWQREGIQGRCRFGADEGVHVYIRWRRKGQRGRRPRRYGRGRPESARCAGGDCGGSQ